MITEEALILAIISAVLVASVVGAGSMIITSTVKPVPVPHVQAVMCNGTILMTNDGNSPVHVQKAIVFYYTLSYNVPVQRPNTGIQTGEIVQEEYATIDYNIVLKPGQSATLDTVQGDYGYAKTILVVDGTPISLENSCGPNYAYFNTP